MVKGKKRSSRQRCVWRETKTNRVYLYLFRYLGPTLSGDFFFFFNIRIFLSPSFRSFLFLFFYSRSLLCFSYFSLFSFLSLFFFFSFCIFLHDRGSLPLRRLFSLSDHRSVEENSRTGTPVVFEGRKERRTC